MTLQLHSGQRKFTINMAKTQQGNIFLLEKSLFPKSYFQLILISNLINSKTLPDSGFKIKAKPSVSGVNMPFDAFFQKECFSIPLQISTILKILYRVWCCCSTGAKASPFCSDTSQLLTQGFLVLEDSSTVLQLSQMPTQGQQEGLQCQNLL